MAKVPGAEPEPVDVGGTIRTGINPEEVGRPAAEMAEASARLADKLHEADMNQQITSGSLANLQALEDTAQDIQQKNDWKNAGARFQSKVSELQDSINNSDAPTAVKTAMLNHLMGYSITKGHELAGWAYEQNIADKQATLETNLEQFVRLGAQAKGQQRTLLFQQSQDAIEAMRSSGLMRDDVAEKLSRLTAQTFDYNSAMEDIKNNPGQAVKDLKGDTVYGHLMPEQRTELYIHAQREENVQGEAQENLIKDKMQDAIDSAANTGIFNRSIMGLVAGTNNPKLLQEFNQKLSDALKTNVVIRGMWNAASPDEREKMLSTLAPTPGQDGYHEQQHLYDIASQANDDIEKAMAKDPAAVVANRVNQNQPTGEQVLQSMSLQKAIGVENPKPLTNDQVNQLAQDYAQAPDDGKANLLASWHAAYGTEGYKQVMRQLYTKLPPSAMFAGDVSPETMKELSMLDKVPLEIAKQQMGSKADDIGKQVDSIWAGYAKAIGGEPPEQSVMRSSFEKLSLDLAHRGDPAAVQHAADALFGKYEFQGTWMAPAGADFDKLKAYGHHIIETAPSFLGGNTDYEREAIRSGLMVENHWQYSHDEGRYYLMNDMGQAVFDHDNNPITFTSAAASLFDKPVMQDQTQPLGGTL